MRQPPFLSLALATALAACSAGEASDPHALVESGILELRSGDPGAAAAQLDRGLAALEPTDPDRIRGEAALAEALAWFEPEVAKTRFLAFGAAHPELVPPELYRAVAEAMFKAQAEVEAVDLLGAACERFEGDGRLEAARDALALRAATGGTPDEVAKLRSLGYLSIE